MTVFRQENVDDYYDTGEELGSLVLLLWTGKREVKDMEREAAELRQCEMERSQI